MVRRALLAAVVFLALPFLAPAPASAGGANLDGQQAPEITLTDGLNGASASTTLQSLRGKVVLLKFWLTRCPICRGTLPAYQSLHDRFGRSGVVCLSIVIDSPAGVGPYLREAGWTFPVGCDPNRVTAARYGMNRYPGDYVIGVDGRVRYSNGFPLQLIEEEMRRQRVLELGDVPESLRAVRDAVADGDYGKALRLGEAAAKAEGAAEDVKAAVTRLADIARDRQDNRFARADALRQRGAAAQARTELERILASFKDTSLEARARERLEAFDGGRPSSGG
jgi:peroxiredoxin